MSLFASHLVMPLVERFADRSVMRFGLRSGMRLDILRGFACLSLLVLLAACETELFRAVPEREANEIIAILARSEINASKKLQPKTTDYQVLVDEADFASAVGVLSRYGFPRRTHENLGQIFQPSGLVPTPFEERVRLVYGISQELSNTLSRFSGITENRVHIVLPHEGRDLKHEARASIFIQYDPEFDADTLIPRIRRLVADSVDGLDSESVEVLAEPRPQILRSTPPPPRYRSVLGINVRAEDEPRMLALLAAIALVFLIVVAVLVRMNITARRPPTA